MVWPGVGINVTRSLNACALLTISTRIGSHDREHGIGNPWTRCRVVLLAPSPVSKFAVSEYVARLREGRYPLAVLKPRVPPDVVGVQMRAHDKIDIVHAESACREVLLVAIEIHHVPKAPRRSRLMVAHASIDHDRVVRCLHDVALDAEHQLIPGIEEPGLQPPSVLVEKLPRHGREKLHRLEEWTLLLDDAVDRGAANFDLSGRDRLPFSYD